MAQLSPSAGSHSHTASGASASAGPAVAVKADTKTTGNSTIALTIAIIGGTLGLAGLILGGLAFTQTRRTT